MMWACSVIDLVCGHLLKKEGILWSYTGWLYFVFNVQLFRKDGRERCCKCSPESYCNFMSCLHVKYHKNKENLI